MAGGVAAASPSSSTDNAKTTASANDAALVDAYTRATASSNPLLTPSASNSYNPYISLGRSQYGNPYAIMGGGTGQIPARSSTPTATNSNLAALSAAYQTTADTAIAKQKADMIAQSNAAQLAYQTSLAKQKAIEDSKYNAMVAQLNQGYVWQNGQLVKPESEFGSAAWFAQQSGYGGASGGLASLEGFDK